MAISCAWIIWEAMQRIVHNTFELRHSLWPVLVLVTSIGVDFWRSRQLRARGQRTGSPGPGHRCVPFCLRHLGFAGSTGRPGRNMAGRSYPRGWLRYADPVAAILVSLMILRMTTPLTREDHWRADGSDPR